MYKYQGNKAEKNYSNNGGDITPPNKQSLMLAQTRASRMSREYSNSNMYSARLGRASSRGGSIVPYTSPK